MKRVKTLLACWDESADLAKRTLGDQFLVTVAHTLEDASRYLLQEPFDLVVATIRFDESRPLELLPVAGRCGVPVVMVRFGASQLPPELVAAVFMAARSLGCKGTHDLAERSRAVGWEAATAEFRASLLEVAVPDEV